MFMKHYAPNRCEPSIEALNFLGGRGGGIRADVNGERFCENKKKEIGGGGSGRGGSGRGVGLVSGGVRLVGGGVRLVGGQG